MWETILLPILKEIGITIAKGAGLGLGAGLSMKVIDKTFPDKKSAEVEVSTAKVAEIKKSMEESKSNMDLEISVIKKSIADISAMNAEKINTISSGIENLARSISELKPPTPPAPAPVTPATPPAPAPATPPAPPVVPPVA